jgi:ATP-binding cassette, subfamily B, bacterial
MSVKKNNIILYPKKYTLFDYIRINFIVAPWFCSISILLKIIDALVPAIQIFITAMFVDTAIGVFKGSKEYNDIFLPLSLIILFAIYDYVFYNLIGFIKMKQYMKLSEYIKPVVIAKRAKIEYKHVENNETWDLISRTCENTPDRIVSGFDIVLSVADIPVRVGSILVILFAQVWWAGLVIFIVSIPLLLLAFRTGKKNYEAYKEARKHERKAQYIDEILTDRDASLERFIFSYSGAIGRKWRDLHEKGRKIQLKAQIRNIAKLKTAGIITMVIALLIAAILLAPLKEKIITVGMFIALIQAVFDLRWMMSWMLANITQKIADNIEFLKDLTRFMALSETEEALEPPDKDIYMQKFESIEFINVTFKYPGTEKYILKGLSFKIEAGMHYAFVGINGAGKTTITKLITGLYDEFDGEILINNKSIREYRLPQLKAMFSVVYQDFAKYFLSLRENIALGGNTDISDEEIMDVVRTIGMEDAVNGLPSGIDTDLGKIRDNSSDISGGQWQRLAIARTLVSKSPVRILDEPTAALDAIAESGVYEMYNRISVGKTTLLITHRLGAIKIADVIILIEDGTVSEIGSHNELMLKCGQYARMYESQRSWYL